MKEYGKEWPEKWEEILRIIFSSLENYGKQSVIRAFQVVLVGKNLPANAGDAKTWVRSVGQEDPLEEEMATHSSILF